jgi:hypothetical protein
MVRGSKEGELAEPLAAKRMMAASKKIDIFALKKEIEPVGLAMRAMIDSSRSFFRELH